MPPSTLPKRMTLKDHLDNKIDDLNHLLLELEVHRRGNADQYVPHLLAPKQDLLNESVEMIDDLIDLVDASTAVKKEMVAFDERRKLDAEVPDHRRKMEHQDQALADSVGFESPELIPITEVYQLFHKIETARMNEFHGESGPVNGNPKKLIDKIGELNAALSRYCEAQETNPMMVKMRTRLATANVLTQILTNGIQSPAEEKRALQ